MGNLDYNRRMRHYHTNKSRTKYKIEHKKEYKISFVGESGTGAKSTLINRIMGKDFDENMDSNTTCRYEFKHVDIGNKEELILNLWDTIGQEKIRLITKLFLKNSDCVVLGYEVTNKRSFEEIKNYWYPLIKDWLECDLIYLVGNKIDLNDRREVSKEEANEYAKSLNLRFFEISCKTKEGLNEFYTDLVNQLIELYKVEHIHIEEDDRKF